MLGAIEALELFGDAEGAVGGAVVDDDYFPVEFAGEEGVSCEGGSLGDGAEGQSYFSVKVRARSQTIMGRLRRSL